MKITKNKLHAIIQEEVAKFSGTNQGTTTEELLEAIRSISNSTNKTLNEKIINVKNIVESLDCQNINDDSVSKFLLLSRLNDEIGEKENV